MDVEEKFVVPFQMIHWHLPEENHETTGLSVYRPKCNTRITDAQPTFKLWKIVLLNYKIVFVNTLRMKHITFKYSSSDELIDIYDLLFVG
jgi:hypothetical protein